MRRIEEDCSLHCDQQLGKLSQDPSAFRPFTVTHCWQTRPRRAPLVHPERRLNAIALEMQQFAVQSVGHGCFDGGGHKSFQVLRSEPINPQPSAVFHYYEWAGRSNASVFSPFPVGSVNVHVNLCILRSLVSFTKFPSPTEAQAVALSRGGSVVIAAGLLVHA